MNFWCLSFLLVFLPQIWAIRRQCMVQDPSPPQPDYDSRLKYAGGRRWRRSILNANITCTERYVVPVLWHILLDTAKKDDITDKTIGDAMDVLNEGFKNSSLIFRLHSIQRVVNDKWNKNCITERNSSMVALGVNPGSFLNIYTCPIQGEILGVATLPWLYNQDDVLNGVTIHPGSLPGGNIPELNQGKNLVHEVGHYYGLLHYFEKKNCSSDGDLVDDTPVSKSETYDCTTVADTCPTQPGVDPVHNYMGYGNDRCVYEFTPGQIKRMDWAIGKYRNKTKLLVYRPCKIDSVFRWSNGFVYFFSGHSYYRYSETLQGIDSQYPRFMNEHWKGVPDNIDGVFRYCDGITYFFKNAYYYKFNDSTLQVEPGYPKNISEFWKGIPDNIDGVMSYSNGETYFFKGSYYYRFNSTTQNHPKLITDYWSGIPSDIDGVLPWYNGGVHFFKDDQFWFSHPASNVIQNPKSIKLWWEDQIQLGNYSVFRHCNGFTYFIWDESYWRFNDQKCSIDYNYPQASKTNWLGLPSTPIDAIFVWSDGCIYVFSENYYYGFNQTTQTLMAGFPRNISSFWLGVPNNIDAVFRSNDGITYFFKDSSYYRFNDSMQKVESGYPKPISSFWSGTPNNVDSVMSWSNGQTYFFKGNNYYRFNYTKGAVDSGFPRSIIADWKGLFYHPGQKS